MEMRGWCLASVLLLCGYGGQVLAEEAELVENGTGEEMGAVIEDEADAFLNEVLEEAEESDSAGGKDYDEISAMRVLERRLMPSGGKQLGDEAGEVEVFSARDPMRLSYDQAMRSLMGTASPIREEDADGGMAHRALEEALRMVQEELEPYKGVEKADGKAGTLLLPFGLDCLEQRAVKEYLALYSSPGSRTIRIWLQRSGKWQAMISRILREEGMPEDLLYLAMIESGFKTRVKSPASAGGMWQFIPSTGVSMGLIINEYVDERFDPEKSTRAAAEYLRKQYQRYHSWPLAMAAYNGGPGTVNVAIDRYNATDYFKLVEYGAMYDETRRYVPKILAAALIGKNPKVFGFEGLIYDEAWNFDVVELPARTKLDSVAKAARCSPELIAELNPELLKDYTPPYVNNYKLRIPAGSMQGFVERFDDLNKKYAKDNERVTLKFGQSIELLAEEIGVPARVLRALNGFDSRETAPYGSEILVPKGAIARSKKSEERRKDGENDHRTVVLVSSENFSFPDRNRYFYTTLRGDKLGVIAMHLGISKRQLALWNDLDPSAKLRPNMHLQVFLPKNKDISQIVLLAEQDARIIKKGSPDFAAWREERLAQNKAQSKVSATSRSSSKYYTVQRGDSLSKIAKKFNVPMSHLLKWNKLKKSSTIKTGMKLRVK
ncbi:MAG: transglycosylase SLT domain-containing protein [Bradymonadia bacterium]|jgi:membrane-bound lytic murein transglycosylase D